jgi:hypothetical protein
MRLLTLAIVHSTKELFLGVEVSKNEVIPNEKNVILNPYNNVNEKVALLEWPFCIGGKIMEGNYYSRNEPAIPRVSDKQPEQCRCCYLGTWTGAVQLCIIPRCWKDEESKKVMK